MKTEFYSKHRMAHGSTLATAGSPLERMRDLDTIHTTLTSQKILVKFQSSDLRLEILAPNPMVTLVARSFIYILAMAYFRTALILSVKSYSLRECTPTIQ